LRTNSGAVGTGVLCGSNALLGISLSFEGWRSIGISIPHRLISLTIGDAFRKLAHVGKGSGGRTGSVNEKVAPRSGLFSAQSRPPCASTMERLIASPMPIPVGLVV